MLKQLLISNYALIDFADIRFESGFTVITGETGAGKSIMLGALALLLGQRADTSVIRDKEQKCVVEATFSLDNHALEPLFKSEDVDFEPETVIRREVLPTGKSRSFVNDTPVTINFLKELSRKLVDIHSQHQNLLLGDDSFQLMVVDTVAGNRALKDSYSMNFMKLKQLQSECQQMINAHQKQQSDRDYISFQAEQLRSAALRPGELTDLERELDQLTHVEEIKSALSEANALMVENDYPLVDGLYNLKSEINKIARFMEGGDELSSRVDSIYLELKDIAREVENMSLAIEFDPQRVRVVQERLSLIYTLLQKHQVKTDGELIELLESFDERLSKLNSHDEDLNHLKKMIATQEEVVKEQANTLSASREKVLKTIEDAIEKQLRELGMPFARFSISRAEAVTYKADGIDEIQFLFSANKNTPVDEIPKIASGGEISRVMLSVKALLSSTRELPTIIFDEIDAGVSGEIADRMGRIMQQMGSSMQVISITHLPQIASKGKRHYKVYKSDTGHQTVTGIKLLGKDERVLEVAGMLSGSEMSEAAIVNARHLLETSG